MNKMNNGSVKMIVNNNDDDDDCDDMNLLDDSELDDLYDDFLNMDTNMSPDFENDIDLDELNIKNNNKNIINNNNTSCVDNVNIELNGNGVDKNGKICQRLENTTISNDTRPSRPTTLFTKTKENEIDVELKEVDEKHSSESEFLTVADVTGNHLLHHGEWGPELLGGLWHSGPSSLTLGHTSNNNQDLASVMSFSSSTSYNGGGFTNSAMSTSRRAYSHQQLGAKVEMVYNLLSMLGTNDREDMSKTLLAMSSSPESCHAMRQSGCLPLLIQLIHSPELDIEVRSRAAQALHNIVHAQSDDKRRRREGRVLKLLEQIREYCNYLKLNTNAPEQDETDKHPGPAIAALMKFSFDEEHRHAMCTLGGLNAVAELIQVDHASHGSTTSNELCVTLRRYAGMALTNLTFGDGNNKALLCSLTKFMHALVAQLSSPSEDLIQVTASVLRNLSWRADADSKQILRDVGAVTSLMLAAMEVQKESTLKSILSALWNLSAHCSMNKVDICSVPGALAFLVKMLTYKPTSNTLAIVENAGGILRNISSHIAVREDYRQILRDNNCFEVLLEQLKSPSLTVVSNSCGTLWNLSARCQEDQRKLWDMGAASMLRSLVQSKHKMISMGSSAALKNLLAANPSGNMMAHLDSTARGLGLQALPSLFARKQRALEQELDANLSETCENIEPSDKSRSRSENGRGCGGSNVSVQKRSTSVPRSDSHESVTSTHSDSVYERVCRVAGNLFAKNQEEIQSAGTSNNTMHESLNSKTSPRKVEEQKLIKRYKCSMIPTPATKKKENKELGVVSEESQTAAANKQEKQEPKRGIPVLKNRARIKQEKRTNEYPSAGSAATNGPASLTSYTNNYDDELPVNYSLKYTEPEETKRKQDYAETDLDQPTDFSLKYGEETSSDEEMKNMPEDTTRTYYTEGTPYETPYNFSTATSMSDLRADVADEQKGYPVENNNRQRVSSNNESGVTTPEHPGKNKQGAGSKMTTVKKQQVDATSTPRQAVTSAVTSVTSAPAGTTPGNNNEAQCKVVTFGVTEEHYVDQTPLMFSRTSSLNSLSSFDQLNQPIPDDRSSVISDFSRRTSGAVSPSELPDSPTQTVPPSPKSGKPPVSFNTVAATTAATAGPGVVVNGKKSVFEDDVASYRQEGTPSEFSRGTSLSSLTIDRQSQPDLHVKANSSASSAVSVDTDDVKLNQTNVSNADDDEVVDVDVDGCNKEDNDKEQVVPEKVERLDLEDVDESMLADCINIGIQDNRHRPRQSNLKSPSKLNYVRARGSGTGIPVKSSMKPTPAARGSYGPCEDTIHSYHTEGTPANISHAGSHSDLSVLSLTTTTPPRRAVEDVSDDSSLCSGDNEHILAECIQSGMPQAKQQKENVRNQSQTVVEEERVNMGSNLSSAKSNNNTPQQNGKHKERIQLLPASDEVSRFATENSPCVFSVGSSLSDLTINSSDSNTARRETGSSRPSLEGRLDQVHLTSPQQEAEVSPSSISLIEAEERGEACKNSRLDSNKSSDWSKSTNTVACSQEYKPSQSDELVTVLSRQTSLSSLSVESFDSCEPTPLEQALLEQCIHSGMPHKPKLITNYDKSDSKNVIAASVAVANTRQTTTTDEENTAVEKMIGSDIMNSSNGGGHTWSEDYTSPESVTSVSISERDGIKVISDGSEEQITPPKFKIGSEITTKLMTDASRICREMKKDFDMIGSVHSEVSLMSCSSFLDAGDFSHLDTSADDFIKPARRLLRMKSYPNNAKYMTTEEQVSLPSLNIEHKTDILDILDLESSMISVASITSEIADVSLRDRQASPTDNLKKIVNIVSEKITRDLTNDEIDTATTTIDKCDTDNVYTETLCSEKLGSDTEIFGDEDDDHDLQNELPLDESPKKKLTPKEKRQITKDRYKTYTIQDLPDDGDRYRTYTKRELKNKTVNVVPQSVCDLKKKITPKERRKTESERFRTQVLSGKRLVTQELEQDGVMEQTTTDTKPLTNIPKTRKQNEDRYKTRTLSSGQLTELLDNAKLVVMSLETVRAGDDSTEVSVVSDDTENSRLLPSTTYDISLGADEDNNPTFIIDDRTYNNTEDEDETLQETRNLGPRIAKPTDKPPEPPVTPFKSVRGRRKPLYTSPVKRPLSTSSPSSGIVREGTFTKDNTKKQTNNTTRNKSAPVLRNTTRPQSSYIARTVATDTNGYGFHKRHSSAGSAHASAKTSIASGVSHKRHSSAGTTMKNSPSNQSIKSNSSVKTVVSVKSRNITQNQRSHSNVSLDSDCSSKSPGSVAPVNRRTPKKEVTSKIASLWKKVEESKKKDKTNVKDNRVWITAEKEQDECLVVEKEEIVDISSGKIVRSSTFQGLIDAGCEQANVSTKCAGDDRTKNIRKSGDFSSAKWESSKKSNLSRPVVSAIVQPYNYHPPNKSKSTGTSSVVKTKQLEDNFHKGSIKITTV